MFQEHLRSCGQMSRALAVITSGKYDLSYIVPRIPLRAKFFGWSAVHRGMSVGIPQPASAMAIVGASCRLPQAKNADQFWDLLRRGRTAVSTVPRARWHASDAGGAAYGAFIDEVDQFDASFFGIAPAEAAALDPQQRLMLELSWEAIESTGRCPTTLRANRVGVFVGAASDDYAILARSYGTDAISRHSALGLSRSIIANRVSYALGLTGPSLTVDSAQSSSLVALHMACESIRSGASEIAIVGAVQLNIAPHSALAMQKLGVLSPTGRCAPLDCSANGTVRGEGAVVLVLKPLQRALDDGDDVRAVVLGSAVNNDGGGVGLTVPTAAAQERVIRAAHAAAGVTAGDIDYVEMHATGTVVGDQCEIAGLGAVFSHRGHPVSVGSVKANIGHLEAAAGLAGLLKVVMSIENGELAPTPHFTKPAPNLDLAANGLELQTHLTEWTNADSVRIAGVSSFGIGGTNAHVVVAGLPPGLVAAERDGVATPEFGGGVVAWVVSGKSAAGLAGQAAVLVESVVGDPSVGCGGCGVVVGVVAVDL